MTWITTVGSIAAVLIGGSGLRTLVEQTGINPASGLILGAGIALAANVNHRRRNA